MDRLLARLERRFGRYTPGNLTYALLAAQIFGFLLVHGSPDSLSRLVFDIDRILAGEVWRAVSWLAIPTSTDPIWFLFAVYWLYTMGTSLESEWGAFKFLVYWTLGIVGGVTAACIAHAPLTNATLLMTLFLAFATLFPDYVIRIFFIIPVKVKWLAYVDALILTVYTFRCEGWEKLIPIAGVANYLLFFGPTLRDRVRGFARHASQAGVRNRMRAERDAASLPDVRRCAICGISNEDPEVDIRVCSCDRCGGAPRDLCLPHARSH